MVVSDKSPNIGQTAILLIFLLSLMATNASADCRLRIAVHGHGNDDYVNIRNGQLKKVNLRPIAFAMSHQGTIKVRLTRLGLGGAAGTRWVSLRKGDQEPPFGLPFYTREAGVMIYEAQCSEK